MRFIFGVIIGICLTVGGAYIADAVHSAPGPDKRDAARMVNWSVVNDNLKDLSTSVQDGWNRLTGHTRSA